MAVSVQRVAGDSVSVGGRLVADDLDLLIRECGGAGGLIIDVSELAYVDRASARALLGLRGAGARLVGCSPFIELCLERADRGAS